MPLLISNKIKVCGLRKGNIDVKNKKFGAVEIGFCGVKGFQKEKGALCVGHEGRIVFEGTACMAAGTIVRVDKGILKIGDRFSSNNNCFFSCTEGITIGNDTLLGWNINIRDSDGHTMYHDGRQMPSLKPVTIGEHVWIASYVDILKGSTIPNGSVVAYRSCLTKPFTEKNTLIAGYPADIVRNNVEWEK